MTGDNLTRAIETLGLVASREDAPAAVSVHYRPASDGFHRWAITTRPAHTADMREGSYYYGTTLAAALREAFADESAALVRGQEREQIDVTPRGTKGPEFVDGPPVTTDDREELERLEAIVKRLAAAEAVGAVPFMFDDSVQCDELRARIDLAREALGWPTLRQSSTIAGMEGEHP